MSRKPSLRRKVREKLEVWKEVFPSIGLAELYRLTCRLKRHAKIFSCRHENGKVTLILGYRTVRDRVSTRVLLSSWVGKRTYQSIRLPRFKPAKIS
ncbi:hypothetical protein [Candidatus Hecatella orcuttiae]|jgi:hypothetical protein|uniref:hypothetical protein n=1 Tax=Candidatus Hecatella orcuttiae TaxID=1935119 RepID=UPI002867EC81|nr:hypothetical protein [Candidatus Hecatella orcuttiae]